MRKLRPEKEEWNAKCERLARIYENSVNSPPGELYWREQARKARALKVKPKR